jgi:hypothetical protein
MPELSPGAVTLIMAVLGLAFPALMVWLYRLADNLRRIESESKDRDQKLEVMVLKDIPSKEDWNRMVSEIGNLTTKVDGLVRDVVMLMAQSKGQ